MLKHRNSIIDAMHEVMGPFPRGDFHQSRNPPEYQIRTSEQRSGLSLQSIEYEAEPGDQVPAYLLEPEDAEAPTQGAVVALHQTISVGKAEPAGVHGSPSLAYAVELAERGYRVLVPDYPGFGDYVVDPYALGYSSTTLKAMYNHMRGIDLLASLAPRNVKKLSVAAIGHSLGGHNALFLAAFDPRVKITVTSCGFTAFVRYKGGDLSAWSQIKYMPRIGDRFGNDPLRMPFDFSDLIVSLAPRALFVNAPEGDTNFAVDGVRICERAAAAAEPPLSHVEFHYPDAGHEFPKQERHAAYEMIDRVIGGE